MARCFDAGMPGQASEASPNAADPREESGHRNRRLGGSPEVTPLFLFVRHAHLDREWPFLDERMRARLGELGELRVVEAARDEPLHRLADLRDVWGLAWLGGA